MRRELQRARRELQELQAGNQEGGREYEQCKKDFADLHKKSLALAGGPSAALQWNYFQALSVGADVSQSVPCPYGGCKWCRADRSWTP